MKINSPSFQAFIRANYKSTKRTSYFEVYDSVFSPYVGQKVTVLEVGVLNGGGLFMLRDLLGPRARIIGVDLNPSCKVFENHGFEIEILNQSDSDGWEKLFQRIGPVDIILEDGGHTNRQQISTLVCCVNNIRDGGVYLSEDTHTSYWREFGNPSRRSFIEFTKIAIDSINSRGPRVSVQASSIFERVYSIQYFESMVCFFIDKTKAMPSERITNTGKSFEHADFRNRDKRTRSKLAVYQSRLAKSKPGLKKSITYRLINMILGTIYKAENIALQKYFKT